MVKVATMSSEAAKEPMLSKVTAATIESSAVVAMTSWPAVPAMTPSKAELEMISFKAAVATNCWTVMS